MSQIGYMIMGVGVTAYTAGVAHFFTHAFFKACLFLGSGIVIHELSDEQDIRLMGGMRTRTPVAFWSMFAAVLAISGMPGFSGYFSKDQVIYGALEHGYAWMWAVGTTNGRYHGLLHVPPVFRDVLRHVSRRSQTAGRRNRNANRRIRRRHNA